MQAGGRRSARWSARRGGLAYLAMCASLAVAACTGSLATPQTIYITLPPSSPVATGTPGQATPVAVTPTVSSVTLTSSAPDGRWTVNFKKPVVSGVTPAAVTAMNDSLTTKVNAYISSFNGTEPPVVASGDGPSTLTGDFTVAFASPMLLSLRFTILTYITGAAHPVADAGSINFNVATGTVIQLPEIFSSPAVALPVLQTQAYKKLTSLLGSDLSWPASVTMSDFGQAWVFTPTGLELTWSQGVIASTAAGTPKISIPWSALKTVIAKPGPAAGFVP